MSAPARSAGPVRRSTPSRPNVRPVTADTLHRMVEAQADRTPDADAVWCDGQVLTYGQLDAAANRLARSATVSTSRAPESSVMKA
ncbi:hypothetical protein ACSNN9_28300, partial [Micromonospora sp. URMC 107]|uniref:hypothetical protein n=1 Tax=Micromonospora sp. URMC 107 TaxID=3423418 RepID=UPI003F1DDD54